MKIHKDDNVIVVAGKDKGKKGKVIRAIPTDDKVVVEGLNMRKKHQKSGGQGKKGQTIEFAAPMHVSNVMVEDPKSKKPTRVGKKLVNGKYVRIAKASGAELK